MAGPCPRPLPTALRLGVGGALVGPLEVCGEALLKVMMACVAWVLLVV